MSEIIHHSRHVECIEHQLVFGYTSDPADVRFGFECSPDGDVLVPLQPEGRANLEYVLAEGDRFTSYVVNFTRSVRFGPVVRCDCGQTVNCDNYDANECSNCRREYNASGHQLAPRSQWGGEFVTQPEEDWGYYPFDPSDGDAYA